MRVESVEGGALEIWTLDRPQARNALDAATFVQLAQAIERAAARATRPGGAAGAHGAGGPTGGPAAAGDAAADGERLRAVILTAEGETFAAGGDLRELRGATSADDAVRLAETGRTVCDGLGALPVPVIAALPGAAIGGGSELAIACDLRIAAPGASLCFKHAHMGVTTAWGVLPRLVSLAGHAGAARLLLTAQTVDAAEGLRLGLFDAVADAAGPSGGAGGAGGANAALQLARRWAGDVVRGAPAAVAGMKSLLRAASRHDGLRALEREIFVETWSSADHADAMDAFFERRPPRWTGR